MLLLAESMVGELVEELPQILARTKDDPRAELMEITEDWVHAAFKIEEKDLAFMERLVTLQNRRIAKLNPQR